MDQFYSIVEPVVDHTVRKLCIRPYPNHKKGCPNWGGKKGCPPQVPLIGKLINLDKIVYAIYNRYEFGDHVERMREKHPKWSKRQLECCLYWQGTARKCLREKIRLFLSDYRDYIIVGCPEGSGVNLTETMKQVGINLEWPPKKYTYQIVLAGKK
ncbi:hypothetical protein LCGC14_1451460 [marine sediment metagenome]|uniref:DUF2284 domain-containing protein n=1 Tax=marine sediment metagenome TaxID=412755 RepID=A0A0F9K439_9ZZZZ